MIFFYTGVPGSGKSYHIAKEIYSALRKGKNVISNVDICIEKIVPKKNKPLGAFVYMPIHKWNENSFLKLDNYGKLKPTNDKFSNIDGLYGFAKQFHKLSNDGKMIEHQTLIIFDECQEMFNSRSWNRADRLSWCKFFRLHRHLGYDCILSSQDDKCIDKQIRAVLQTQVLHRNLSYFKKLGKIIAKILFGGNCFICIETLYGMSKKDNHIKSYIISGDDYYFSLYDSFEII